MNKVKQNMARTSDSLPSVVFSLPWQYSDGRQMSQFMLIELEVGMYVRKVKYIVNGTAFYLLFWLGQLRGYIDLEGFPTVDYSLRQPLFVY